MSIDMNMGMEKERIRELDHRQKVRFSTLLLPVLVAWNTLDTRPSMLFVNVYVHSTLPKTKSPLTKNWL